MNAAKSIDILSPIFSKSKRSRLRLATFMAILFSCAAVVCMGLLAGLMVYRSSKKIESHMQSFIATTAVTLEGSLADAVWNFDRGAIEKVVESVLNQPNSPLRALKLDYTNLGETLVRYNRNVKDQNFADIRNQPGTWMSEHDIHYNGQVVAHLTLLSSSQEQLQESHQETMMICFWIFVCFGAMSFAVVNILNRILTIPLNTLVMALRQTKFANYNSEVNEALYGELGTIATEFNSAIKAISERDRRLNLYATHLEGEVAEGAMLLQEQKMRAENSARLAALGEMSAGVAHEINNPLAIIHASSERMEKVMSRPIDNMDSTLDVVRTEIRRVQKMVERISKIVTGLRSFARDGSSDESSTFKPAQMIEEILGLTRSKLLNKGILITVNCPTELTAFGSEIQISQVIINLLNNSVDAVEVLDEKWIRINVSTDGQRVKFSIVDSGAGVPERLRSKIFQPFFTTKEVGKGTGLGLSIAHGIIKSHGGSIDIDTKNANTCIYFTISANSPPLGEEE